MSDCIFCKIAKHEMPKDFTYESKEVMAFPDIHPLRPIHLLVVPKKHIGDFIDMQDNQVCQEMRKVIQKLVRENKLTDRGYRLVINGGGAQIIDHLHIHILGPIGQKEAM